MVNPDACAEQEHKLHIFAGTTTNCLLKEANLERIELPLYEELIVSIGMRFFRKSMGGSGLITVLAMKLSAGFESPYPIDMLILRRVLGGHLVESE